MTARTEKVTLKTKLAFSAGALDEAVMSAAGVATMLFYNQVLGVSAYLCGVVFLVASIVDAISDPLVGSLSDNFRSRWGRRHPFMLIAMVPLCLGFFLLYVPPAEMSETFYFWWFMGALILMRLGKTFYVVPHDALGAELTDDYHERTQIFGLNSVVGMLAGAGLGAAVLVLYFPETEGFENGLLNPAGYLPMATAGATIMCIALLVCIAGTRDQIPRLHAVERQQVRMRESLRDLASLVRSKAYLSVCVAWLVMLVSGGILGSSQRTRSSTVSSSRPTSLPYERCSACPGCSRRCRLRPGSRSASTRNRPSSTPASCVRRSSGCRTRSR